MKPIKKEPEAPVAVSAFPEFEKVSPEGFDGIHIVRNKGVPQKTRQAGQSKYPVGLLKPGDSISSNKASDIRNARVAATAWAKRQATNGEPKPVFVTRKEPNGIYSLIRES